MSSPDQPGNDQKRASVSGQVPPKPEQSAAPAGTNSSKPPVGQPARDPGQPAASASIPAQQAPTQAQPTVAQSRGGQVPPWQRGAQRADAARPTPQADAARTGADKPVEPAAPVKPEPAAPEAKPSQAVKVPPPVKPNPTSEPAKPAVAEASKPKQVKAPTSPNPTLAKAPQNAPAVPQNAPPQSAPAVPQSAPAVPQNAPAVPQNAPAVPQREPQTNIIRPGVDTAKSGVQKSAPGGPRPVQPTKKPVDDQGRPAAGTAVDAGKDRPPTPPTRPVVTGTAAPGANSQPASRAKPAGAPDPKAVAAVIDGPTRHIDRKDLPKDMPDLSEAKHPLPQTIRSEKSHAANAEVADGAPLRATVQVRRIDPWSTLKITSVIAVSLFFVWMVAVGLLYVVLDGMGVWDRLNNAFTDIVADGGSDGLVTAGEVFGYAALIGVANMVLFTALVTIGSFIYNLCSDLVGGVEVTLADRD
ncbi:hypothetical protein ABH922_004741 [Rhodococcus sp. 27YEA15]|uniref:DUF3566 domain-containing protein n=1 Tax=Rhodococcus sp. 27YEA15 TaxID=3156259 RepID=UPI003C7D5B94